MVNFNTLRRVIMFKLSKLKIGQKANLGHLKTLIENQNFTIHGNQVVGEIV